MKKIDIDAAPTKFGTGYPPPYDAALAGRAKRALGDVFNLTQFGVNLTVLAPGSASAHRHWHESEDEFVYVLSGDVCVELDGAVLFDPELVLETDLGTGVMWSF